MRSPLSGWLPALLAALLISFSCDGEGPPGPDDTDAAGGDPAEDPVEDADVDSQAEDPVDPVDPDVLPDVDGDPGADPDCEGDGCAGACPDDDLGEGLGATLANGATEGAFDDVSGSCGGAGEEDVTYSWRAPADGLYTFIVTGDDWDPILIVLDTTCEGDELGCEDELALTLQTDDAVVLAVDGGGGEFSLGISGVLVTSESGLCGDGRDNDGDGPFDCGDANCALDAACVAPVEDCDTVGDEDDNGAADCLDAVCCDLAACEGVGVCPAFEDCDQVGDEDDDGLADCLDLDCCAELACRASEACLGPPETCDDFFDDDGDGSADCGDPDCCSDPRCSTADVCRGFEDDCAGAGDTDGDGLEGCADLDCCTATACADSLACLAVPADPSDIAPPIDVTAPPDFFQVTQFLYTGDAPTQRGVAPGTISPTRVAVLRGLVRDREGPLSGVRIDILDHPELGMTATRSDGGYEVVVNGGRYLTVNFFLEGYVPMLRQVWIDPVEYTPVPELVLTAYDSAVTLVELTSDTDEIQVARGNPVTDADGDRQATLLFAPGTTAEMILPSGEAVPVTSLSVRATEFTVGPDGPAAMPLALPPYSGYTYCVELSADEAVEAGATSIRFDKPVQLYVENFLGFPTGIDVPLGYLDYQRGVWIAEEDGRIIEILDTTGGIAALNIDGDPEADPSEELTALGITAQEQEELAALYAAGQSLWRLPRTHFTQPVDPNHTPPTNPGAARPNAPPPEQASGNDSPDDDNTEQCASIVDVQARSLGEAIDLVGTGLRLFYNSYLAPGHTRNRITIPATGATLPDELLRVEVTVDVAGTHFSQTFEGETLLPNQTVEYEWDGRDGYGRLVSGSQVAEVQVAFFYPGTYLWGRDVDRAFGRVVTEVTFPGAQPVGEETNVVTDERAPALARTWRIPVGQIVDPALAHFAGWSLENHHSYDVVSRTLHMGDGSERAASVLGTVLTTVAGDVPGAAVNGDGGPATEARIGTVEGMTLAPDGTIYLAYGDRVRRINAEGVLEVVAGSGPGGPLVNEVEDGSPALSVDLQGIMDIDFGPDGNFYFAHTGGRVSRVDPEGRMWHVAGDGGTFADGNGDGGPAVDAALGSPMAIAVGPDGSVFVLANNGQSFVRRIATDGIITTFAGGMGNCCTFRDGIPATQAYIQPWDIDVGPDGSLYIADAYHYRVRRVTPDGIIHTFAGTGTSCCDFDSEVPAELTDVFFPSHLSVAPDGSVVIAEHFGHAIRVIDPGGIIHRVAGDRTLGWGEANVLASGSGLADISDVLWTPDGILLAEDRSVAADRPATAVRLVRSILPGTQATELVIPAEDGSEVYVFTNNGRHLRTLDGLTGATRWTFGYDPEGRLVAVSDGFGNTTTIVRNEDGEPARMVGPYGHETLLDIGDDGFLAEVQDPAGHTHAMTYRDGGLLETLTDPRGGLHEFEYDDLGRLRVDEDAGDGSLTLELGETADGFTVTETTALGRETLHTVDPGQPGQRTRQTVWPDGTLVEVSREADGSRTVTSADGTVRQTVAGPDPRFGMQVPRQHSMTITTPGGLALESTATYSAVTETSFDPLAFDALEETHVVNGRTFTATYDAATRTWTETTHEGRVMRTVLDEHGLVVGLQLGDLFPVVFQRDARGRVDLITQGTRVFDPQYDARGDLVRLVEPLERTTVFTYDEVSRVTSILRNDESVVGFGYDAHDNLVTLTPPGRPLHELDYTPVDLTERYGPPDIGLSTEDTLYDYNADRQLMSVDEPGPNDVTYAYDDTTGRLTSMTAPHGTLSFGYHAETGMIETITAPGPEDLAFTHDGFLLTGTTWSGSVAGTVTQTYDDDFRMASQSVNGGSTVDFQHDDDNLLIAAGALTLTHHPLTGLLTRTSSGLVANAYTYNEYGEVATFTATVDGEPLYSVVYVRDDLGRIQSKAETTADGTTITAYRYDGVGRLESVTVDGIETTYGYDGNGNREGGEYDAQDRLRSHGGTTYTYTDSGYLETRTEGEDVTEYTYDALGNLLSVTMPAGTDIEYVVDGLNRRVGRRVDGVLMQGFLYSGQLRVAAELDGTGAIVSRFVYATHINVPDLMIRDGVTYAMVTDQVGSVRLVVNTTTGEVAQRIDYDAFGNVTSIVPPESIGLHPFGFAGGMYDPTTRLARFGARDYDAELGRWTSKDPIGFAGRDLGLYTYSLGDPVNFQDPTGLWGFGVTASAGAEMGQGTPGATSHAGSGQLALWGFSSGEQGMTASGGLVNGTPAAYAPGRPVGYVAGASSGLGVGWSITNADCLEQLGGSSDQLNINTPIGSLSFSWSRDANNDLIIQAGFSIGPGSGTSVSYYPTETAISPILEGEIAPNQPPSAYSNLPRQ